MARLVIQRKGQFNAALRDCAILIDGEKVGVVGNGKTFEVDVTPGVHNVQSRMDWVKSKPLDVNVGANGATLELSLCNAFLNTIAILGIVPFMKFRQV